jgi:hypothetical protein
MLGQYFDLLELFRLNGFPTEKHHYLFNGDFVDRGSWSTEIALLLYAYKWLRPSGFFVNRGNHETDDMNRVYGFEGECKAKYNGLPTLSAHSWPLIIGCLHFIRTSLQAILRELFGIATRHLSWQEVSRSPWWIILGRQGHSG